MNETPQSPIKDYFLIGNLHSAALVSKDASIDWLCLPHFDSPSVFGKILDKEKGGSFSLHGMEDRNTSSEYIKDTAIVRHSIENSSGAFAQIDDFMLPQPKVEIRNHFLVRELTGIKGSSEISFCFHPRPEYGAKTPEIERSENKLSLPCHGGNLILHLPDGSEKSAEGEKIIIKISLDENKKKRLILEYVEHDSAPVILSSENPTGFFEDTKNFWKKWTERHNYVPFCRDGMARSAITLKLMQYYPTGAIIAAPTASLPEEIGGVRNWDYRFVWLRDATFTLYSLSVIGCTEEAIKFFEFLEQSVQWENSPSFELMYTIHGKRVPEEETLSHLEGYKKSAPVRIGNDAVNQFQLDLFGTLIDFIYFSVMQGIEVTEGMRKLALRLIMLIEENWHKKDQGLWEMRNAPVHFTHSKVVSWVGVDRALRLKKDLRLSEEEVKKLEKLREEIRDWIWEHAYDEESGVMRQHPETGASDSTNFLFVLLQFLDKNDPKTARIIRRTADDLLYDGFYVHRYKTADGLPGTEGAFLLSTFWLISALALLGETDEAMKIFREFEKTMPLSGLMSEEIDPASGEFLGNFPQAFSHMGYIMAAYYINREKGGVDIKEDLGDL